MPMKCGFLPHLTQRRYVARARVNCILRAFAHAQWRQHRRIHRAKKILRRTPPRARRQPHRGAKRANQCQAIRADGAFRGRARRRADDAAREFFAPFRLARRMRRVFFARAEMTPLSRSDSDPLLQKIVDRLRIGFAARRFHHLADEPTDCPRVRFGVGDLVGVLGDDVVDELFDG